MNYSKKRKEETFIIKIKDGQYNTWQGSVLWVDEQKEKSFRSALELLKLVDEALAEKKDEESKEE